MHVKSALSYSAYQRLSDNFICKPHLSLPVE